MNDASDGCRDREPLVAVPPDARTTGAVAIRLVLLTCVLVTGALISTGFAATTCSGIP